MLVLIQCCCCCTGWLHISDAELLHWQDNNISVLSAWEMMTHNLLCYRSKGELTKPRKRQAKQMLTSCCFRTAHMHSS